MPLTLPVSGKDKAATIASFPTPKAVQHNVYYKTARTARLIRARNAFL